MVLVAVWTGVVREAKAQSGSSHSTVSARILTIRWLPMVVAQARHGGEPFGGVLTGGLFSRAVVAANAAAVELGQDSRLVWLAAVMARATPVRECRRF
jgi:hypothetical protein